MNATELSINEDEIKTVKCLHGCKDEPVGIFHMPEGCVCFDHPIQALCAQHFHKAQSEGRIIWLIKRVPKGVSVAWSEPVTKSDGENRD